MIYQPSMRIFDDDNQWATERRFLRLAEELCATRNSHNYNQPQKYISLVALQKSELNIGVKKLLKNDMKNDASCL
jgi:hypothetical protein